MKEILQLTAAIPSPGILTNFAVPPPVREPGETQAILGFALASYFWQQNPRKEVN